MKIDTTHERYEQLNDMYASVKSRKLLHWLLIILCTVAYISLNFLLVFMTFEDNDYNLVIHGIPISKFTLSGVIAQGQVISVVLITLNPIKRSNFVALFLCLVTGLASISKLAFGGSTKSIPGLLIAITSACVVIIITGNENKLNKQIHKVLEYTRILKNNDEMLHQMAYYDAFTGLPNRKMMIDQIELLIDNTSQNPKSFVIVYIDLDNFKKINDSLGHSLGDALLNQIAMRYRERCHKEDLLGRVGGDEFVLLIRENLNDVELIEYLESYRTALSDVIIVERKEFYVSASFGITKYPQDGNDADELFKNARIALYNAQKSRKVEYMFFNRKMQDEVLRRIKLENGLLVAIRNKELYMVFQPQFICCSNTLRGYEALVRWKNSELGLISPSEFIPISEETGYIIEMGKWIIETTLRKFKVLKECLNISAVVSINISVVQMIEPSFVTMIKDILEETKFDPEYLELEITESVFIASPDHVIEVINQLKELGIRIALDDFGTGYASLNYLQMLPINVLKIDKTFIDKITSYQSLNTMVGTIISLSHQLGIEVVAEGVEHEEQLMYLKRHRCDYIQGYLLSKPMEEEQLMKMNEINRA